MKKSFMSYAILTFKCEPTLEPFSPTHVQPEPPVTHPAHSVLLNGGEG